MEKNPLLAVLVAILVSGGTGTGVGALANSNVAVLENRVLNVEKQQDRTYDELRDINEKLDRLLRRNK